MAIRLKWQGPKLFFSHKRTLLKVHVKEYVLLVGIHTVSDLGVSSNVIWLIKQSSLLTEELKHLSVSESKILSSFGTDSTWQSKLISSIYKANVTAKFHFVQENIQYSENSPVYISGIISGGSFANCSFNLVSSKLQNLTFCKQTFYLLLIENLLICIVLKDYFARSIVMRILSKVH